VAVPRSRAELSAAWVPTTTTAYAACLPARKEPAASSNAPALVGSPAASRRELSAPSSRAHICGLIIRVATFRRSSNRPTAGDLGERKPSVGVGVDGRNRVDVVGVHRRLLCETLATCLYEIVLMPGASTALNAVVADFQER